MWPVVVEAECRLIAQVVEGDRVDRLICLPVICGDVEREGSRVVSRGVAPTVAVDKMTAIETTVAISACSTGCETFMGDLPLPYP